MQCVWVRVPQGLTGFLCPEAQSCGPYLSARGTNGSWGQGYPELRTVPTLRSNAHRDVLTCCQLRAGDMRAIAEKAAIVRKK